MTAGALTTAYLGLGANLGDRAATIGAALERLAAAGIAIEIVSPLYETDAVTPDPQPPFVNAAARVSTTLSARALLAACLDVERALGRARPAGRAHAARAIDIDLLLYGGAIIDEPPALIVPHPRLAERAFVLVPLALVAQPGLRHPATGQRLDRAAPSPSVRPLAPR